MAPPFPPLPPSTATTTAHHPHSNGRRRSPEARGGGKRPRPHRPASFHGRTPQAPADQRGGMRRPKTQPDLLAAGWRNGGGGLSPPDSRSDGDDGARRVPAKVLVNVTVQRSLGAVQVMASTEWSVGDLAAAAVRIYVKEGRRPPLPTAEPSAFGLHYSQFSLESLDPKEKLVGLGSRNFFLCPNSSPAAAAAAEAEAEAEAAGASASSSSYPTPPSTPLSSPSSSCSKEAEKASKMVIPWLRFMDFLL